MRSDANIQAVKDIYAAFQTGDIPAILAVLADEVEWSHPGAPDLPFAGTTRGREGAAAFFQKLGAALDFRAFEPTAYLSEGEEVAAFGHYEALDRTSGRAAQDAWAMRWTFRGGKVVRWQGYTDTLSAAKALGSVQSVPAGAPA